MRKLIGRGTFSKAYQIAEDRVELISTCPAKECYALFSQHNPLAPKIERNFDKENSFFMPLYPKIKTASKQLNAKSYQLYKELRSIESGIDYYKFVKVIEAHTRLSEEDKENIISLAENVCNGIDPQQMRFEISPRNISCDKEGNLILLDCFFCVKTMINTRSR